LSGLVAYSVLEVSCSASSSGFVSKMLFKHVFNLMAKQRRSAKDSTGMFSWDILKDSGNY